MELLTRVAVVALRSSMLVISLVTAGVSIPQISYLDAGGGGGCTLLAKVVVLRLLLVLMSLQKEEEEEEGEDKGGKGEERKG